MKKVLFTLMIIAFTGVAYANISFPYDLQVVKPDEDIKSMYENEQYQEIIDQYAGKPRSLSVTELIYVAQSYLQFEDLESATIFIQMATQKDPKSALAYYVDGIVTNMIGNHQQAINKFRTAIKLSPDNSDYYIALGDVYYVQEKYNEALAEYEKALKVSNPSEKSYYMLGVAYMGIDDHKRALDAFYEAKKKVVKDKELYVTILYNIGKTEYDNKQYKAASEIYNELIEYFPDDYYSIEKLIQCYNAIGDYDNAGKNKAILYKAYSNGYLDDSSLADMFGIEHFPVGNMSVAGYERYESITDEVVVKNIFYVLDNTGSIESAIYLEYTPAPDGKISGNVIMTKGSERYSCGVKFSDQISYGVLKQSIIDIVSGKIPTTLITSAE
ncbi:tetratricopeptide (TPR) repeat protein [Dysgonomonas hofstadii]|uniref:Tetratricopeptide (TPR) repeat protein n=1 Tax=Dysgonomonas hofstadii TaxID=637886 RepID=A0A840CT27_9BACT|nr:tetratricopeptide repeat protein [Dysgonomonas hofstadii]MBB4035692.1 tetratricopeptide (TPR) repeat protein [Dysgonomonas hofstadii]